MGVAIYPGTFDPVTLGHLDMIERAAAIFDQVIVAIASNTRKQPFYSLETRIKMLEMVLADTSNIRIASFETLTVSFAKQHGACILRGLRAVADFDFEFQLAGMNQSLCPEVETIFLPATPAVSHISSTMVREIISLGGDVSKFIDPRLLPILEENHGANHN